jgi:hypothetical protein
MFGRNYPKQGNMLRIFFAPLCLFCVFFVSFLCLFCVISVFFVPFLCLFCVICFSPNPRFQPKKGQKSGVKKAKSGEAKRASTLEISEKNEFPANGK